MDDLNDVNGMLSRRDAIATGGAAIATALAGCGFGSEDDKTTGTTLESPVDGNDGQKTTRDERTATGDGNVKTTTDDGNDEDQTPTEEPLIGNYQLDVKPAEGSERTESIIFSNHSTEREDDDYTIDLAGMDQLHENDLDRVLDTDNRDWDTWLQSFEDESLLHKIKNDPRFPQKGDLEGFKNAETLPRAMHWIHPYAEKFDVVGKDGEVKQNLFDGDNLTEDEIMLPSESPEFAALMEQAIDEYSSAGDVHLFSHPIWERNTDGEYFRGIPKDDDHRYPMMAGWDVENQEILIIKPGFMQKGSSVEEHVLGTQSFLTRRMLNEPNDTFQDTSFDGIAYHPSTEHSAFLPYFGKAGYNKEEIRAFRNLPEGSEDQALTVKELDDMAPAMDYWHPLRFGFKPDPADYDPGPDPYDPTPTPEEGETQGPYFEVMPSYEKVGIEYETAARLAGSMLRRMVSMKQDDITETIEETSNLAMTNKYLADVMAEMREGGEKVSFEDLYDQAKIVHSLTEEDEGNYVAYGTADNPQYAKVEDQNVVNQIWNDESGEFNEFTQFAS